MIEHIGGFMKSNYLNVISSVERIHRLFLEVIDCELERLKISDIKRRYYLSEKSPQEDIILELMYHIISKKLQQRVTLNKMWRLMIDVHR